MKPSAPKGSSHAPAPMASPLAAPAPMASGNSFAAKSLATPMPDFSPAPMAMPASARQSQILSISDFNDVVNRVKPVFFVSTTQTVDGFQIQEYLGLISVEVVIPKDLLFRNPAPYGELHRIKAAEDQLQKVKAKALEELGEKAKEMGADGVVGVSLQFSQFDAIVFLCSAVGTAVKLAG
ncbi:MAG: YbjQ family protein [Fibrobacterota bacterium]|nr:YbjQ family protein [Fibrobacterota bacterium]